MNLPRSSTFSTNQHRLAASHLAPAFLAASFSAYGTSRFVLICKTPKKRAQITSLVQTNDLQGGRGIPLDQGQDMYLLLPCRSLRSARTDILTAELWRPLSLLAYALAFRAGWCRVTRGRSPSRGPRPGCGGFSALTACGAFTHSQLL